MNVWVLAETHLDFSELQSFLDQHKAHTFGYFSYDVKNSVEQLQSNNEDAVQFPLAYFFVPKFLFEISEDIIVHYFENDAQELEQLLQFESAEIKEKISVSWQSKITKKTYLDKVNNIKQHIRRGDAYELNFCYDFLQKMHT
jgi:para-aminobenzoate synthetase component I